MRRSRPCNESNGSARQIYSLPRLERQAGDIISRSIFAGVGGLKLKVLRGGGGGGGGAYVGSYKG